jgi:hypothetical protein
MNMERLQGLVDLIGKTRLVLDLSCRKKVSCLARLIVKQNQVIFSFLSGQVISMRHDRGTSA